MVIFPELLGLPFDEHDVAPAVPEIAQFTTPVGAAELVAPVTVVVKMRVPPRVGEPEDVKRMVGVADETVVELSDATAATGLYAPPPVKVKVAE